MTSTAEMTHKAGNPHTVPAYAEASRVDVLEVVEQLRGLKSLPVAVQTILRFCVEKLEQQPDVLMTTRIWARSRHYQSVAATSGDKSSRVSHAFVMESMERITDREQDRYRLWRAYAMAVREAEKEADQSIRGEKIAEALKDYSTALASLNSEGIALSIDAVVETIAKIDNTAVGKSIHGASESESGGYVSNMQELLTKRSIISTSGKKISEIHAAGAVAQTKKIAGTLVRALSDRKGVFAVPRKAVKSEYGDAVGSDFVVLGSGEEKNVYLHKPSGTVYKIDHDRNGNINMNGRVHAVERALEGIDGARLREVSSRYASTIVHTVLDRRGREVPVVVQAFLDPDVWVPYDPLTVVEKNMMASAGVSDLHGGNIVMRADTLEVVLFDCLYAQESKMLV